MMKIPRSLTVLLLSGYFVCSYLPVVAQTTTTIEKTTTIGDEQFVPGSTVTRTTTVDPAFPGSTVEKTTTVQSGYPQSAVERTTTIESGVPGSSVTRTTTVEGMPETTRVIVPQGLFSPSDTYIVVDPLSGSTQGTFDIETGTFNGRMLSNNYVIVDKFTGKVLATADNSGQIIAISSVPATSALLSAIDARRAAIDHLITNALANGQISSQTATYFRGQLDRIAADELIAAQTGGVVTYSKALAIANSLTLLQNEFPSAIVTSTISTPVIGGRFLYVNGQLVMPNSIEYRRVALSTLMDDEYKAGRLSSGQVNHLKDKLNEVSFLEAKYTRKGELSDSKVALLNAKLDIIKSDVGEDIASTNAKRAQMGLVVY
jgi:hypothetical protein